jgi:hypothetical protein
LRKATSSKTWPFSLAVSASANSIAFIRKKSASEPALEKSNISMPYCSSVDFCDCQMLIIGAKKIVGYIFLADIQKLRNLHDLVILERYTSFHFAYESLVRHRNSVYELNLRIINFKDTPSQFAVIKLPGHNILPSCVFLTA